MPQQRINPGFPAPEGLEQIRRVRRTAFLQDVVQKSLTALRIEHAFLFEQGKGIRRQYLGPFITVVAGGITSGEDMRETVREPIKRRRLDDRHLIPNLLKADIPGYVRWEAVMHLINNLAYPLLFLLSILLLPNLWVRQQYGWQQVLILDLETGRELGRLKAVPAP